MKKSAPYMNQVLLVDDDQDHALLFERILKQVDPTKSLIVFSDPNALIKYLEKQKPDLIFLDLNMPCKNGLQCLQEIRQEPSLNNIPIVVYSSSTHMTDIQRSYLYKADLYMVKPFNSEHLKNALLSILDMNWRDRYTNEKYYFINNRFVPYTA